MSRIWGLFKKELRGYFNSPIAYIVVTILLIGIGYLFFQTFFIANQATLRSFFRFAAWTFLLFGPAVTMKLFAEEKKSGTIEPLLTLPLQEYQIVLGKFLAAWSLLGIYLLITLAYPITIGFIGDLDTGPIIGGYLGLYLLGGTFIAMGIFASTITRNQVVSLILAFTIGLLLFMLDLLLPFIPESLQSLVEFIGVDSHFKNTGRGVIDTRDVVYSLSLIGIFLFMSVQVLQARMNDNTSARKVNKVLYIGSAIGCLISLNVLSFNLYGRVDLTEDKMFTLSKASRELVADLPDQLTVKVFFSKNLPAPFNNHARYLRDKLVDYRNYSNGNLIFEFIDPGRLNSEGKPDPELSAQVSAAKIPKVEVSKLEKDQVQMVKVYMGLAMYYQDKIETIPLLQKIDDLEYEISSRITKLTRDREPTLGFLTGHGELTAQQGAANVAQILKQKYQIKDVNLSGGANALGDIDILVIGGPKQPLPEDQLFFIDQYIMGGGKVAFLLDANLVDMSSFIGRPFKSGLEKLVETYGVHLSPGMVLDQVNQRVGITRAQGNIRFQSMIAFPPFIRVQDLAKDSPLTRNLRDLTIPFASPLKTIDRNNVESQVIARTSPKTWLFENEDSFLVEPQLLPAPTEKDFIEPQNLIVTLKGGFDSYYRDQGIPKRADGSGPVATSLEEVSPETRLAVISSSTWLHDQMRNRLGIVFFANLMDWLAADERLIGIRTRSIVNRPLEKVSDTTKNIIKYGNMILLPIVFVFYGIFRWRLRLRKKRKGIV